MAAGGAYAVPVSAARKPPQIPESILDLGRRFEQAGFELALVGGPVRDELLGRASGDWDLTTNAHPEQTLAVLDGWAEVVWDVGIRFGTVGGQRHGLKVEITTYRTEQYQDDTRKPEVQYGTSLEDDLFRRDFTVNAMAVRLPSCELVDPFGGLTDVQAGVLRTPGTAEMSFSDDPLRMMRAARFASQLGFRVVPEVVIAMTEMASRLSIVSAERIQVEFSKLLLGAHPREGLTLLVETGLAEQFIPELGMLRLEIDEHHHHKDVYEHSLTVLEQAIALEQTHQPESEPDLVLRLAALLHDIGKPKTRRFEHGGGVSFHHHEVVGAKLVRKRLSALRYSNEIIEDVSKLVELHLRFHGYGSGDWTDSAVRRYVRDAGDQLVRLHKLTRADCTTRNRRKAFMLQATYDELERHITELAAQEELDSIRPDLDGNAIMELLGVGPGPVIGRAYKFLLELRMEQGPLAPEQAAAALRAWWDQELGELRLPPH